MKSTWKRRAKLDCPAPWWSGLFSMPSAVQGMAAALKEIALQKDSDWRSDRNGETSPMAWSLKNCACRVGVIAMIYESRPNVTVDATALCLKSGNAILLRGGSEAINSNRAIINAVIQGGRGGIVA